jgi:hypothetical protein
MEKKKQANKKEKKINVGKVSWVRQAEKDSRK